MKANDLKKKQMQMVRKHLKEAERVVKLKHDMLTGNIEELGELDTKTKDEVDQLMKLVQEADENAPELKDELLALEVNTRKLKESIEKEAELVKTLEEDALKDDEKDILKEMDEEILFSKHLGDQLEKLSNIKNFTASVIKQTESTEGNHTWKEGLCVNLNNLNSIASFFINKILNEELGFLQLAYNALKEIERPELEKQLREIQMIFGNINQRFYKD